MTRPDAGIGIGIPYARVEARGGRWFAICPACNAAIELREMKDWESFTKREYAEHYANCAALAHLPLPPHNVCAAPDPCDCEHCAEEARITKQDAKRRRRDPIGQVAWGAKTPSSAPFVAAMPDVSFALPDGNEES